MSSLAASWNRASGLSAELRLVAACTLRPASAAVESWRAELIRLSRAVRDWARVIALVQRHQVYGLVHAALADLPATAGVPAPLQQQLAALARNSRLQALLRLSDARRVADAFQRAAVPIVQLKGAPLSARLYIDPLLRHSTDIDVVVPQALLGEAAHLLSRLGYSTHEELPWRAGLQDRMRRRAYHHCTLRSPHKVMLELHWRMGTYSAAHTEQLVAQSLPNATTGLACLPPGAELVYLVSHGTSHYWARLKWLGDIQQALLCAAPELWQRFAAECAAVGAQDAVTVTRCLLGEVFPTAGELLPQGGAAQTRHWRSARYALYRMQAPLELEHGMRSVLERTRYRLDCATPDDKVAAVLRVANKMRMLARHS